MTDDLSDFKAAMPKHAKPILLAPDRGYTEPELVIAQPRIPPLPPSLAGNPPSVWPPARVDDESNSS